MLLNWCSAFRYVTYLSWRSRPEIVWKVILSGSYGTNAHEFSLAKAFESIAAGCISTAEECRVGYLHAKGLLRFGHDNYHE
jgi:hypothetical protein